DPSSDNYQYYRGGSYDNQQADIIERYKKFNGFEGNSITTQDSPESYPIQATTLPTTEDVNQDLTLGEAESYYQYEVEMPDSQISLGDWLVGTIYMTDVVDGVDPDGRQVKWYQLKIPVRDGKSINNMQVLRSIRYMRVVTKGF